MSPVLLSPPVLILFSIAIASMYTIYTVDWTLVPFLHHVTPTLLPITLYLRLSALRQLVPLLASALLGLLSSRIGSVRALALAYSFVWLGILAFVLAPQNIYLVTAGIFMYSTISALRVVRIAILADLVAPCNRTATLAWHLAISPVAALIAPSMWDLLQNWHAVLSTSLWSGSEFVFDRFTLNHTIALVMLTAAILAIFAYRDKLDTSHVTAIQTNIQGNRLASPEYGTVNTNMNIQQVRQANATPTTQWTLIFIPLLTGPNLGLCASAKTLQPALMGPFGKVASYVAHTYTVMAAIGLVPPFCIATLSNKLSDHTLLLKLSGGVLYMPLFGGISASRVAVAFVLLVLASSFFTTALLSMFSKKVEDPRQRAAALGILWSVAHAVPALLQLLLADRLMAVFGSWTFCLAFLPTAMVFVAVMSPWFARISKTQWTSSRNNNSCLSIT